MLFLAETYSNCSAELCFEAWLFDDDAINLTLAFVGVTVIFKVAFRIYQIIAEAIPF